LLTTAATGGGLDLTLSATDALAVVALAAAKSAIMAVLRIREDDFTLGPAFPELFVATFRSQESRDRASAVSVSQEGQSLSVGLLGHSEATTPVTPLEVPPSAEVVPVVEVSHVEMPPSAEVVSVVEVPPVEVPPSAEIVVPASEEATSTVEVSEDCNSAALEDFISKVTKNILPPLVNKPPRRCRVDPVLIDAPPQLPSSKVTGPRRSHRQALYPLSAVKPAKRGVGLLMRRLGEVGTPLPLRLRQSKRWRISSANLRCTTWTHCRICSDVEEQGQELSHHRMER